MCVSLRNNEYVWLIIVLLNLCIFCVVLCISLLVLLSFLFSTLYCLYFFDVSYQGICNDCHSIITLQFKLKVVIYRWVLRLAIMAELIVFCIVLLRVFTFQVSCCDVRYDFRIRFAVTLFLFACTQWCPTHIYCCVVVLFFFILCSQCLWIFHFWLHLRYYLTFI
jgi:hypothetical protein